MCLKRRVRLLKKNLRSQLTHQLLKSKRNMTNSKPNIKRNLNMLKRQFQRPNSPKLKFGSPKVRELTVKLLNLLCKRLKPSMRNQDSHLLRSTK